MEDVGTDEELVRRCQAGDRAAFDDLVRRHERQIYRLCYRFVGNHEDASELAQDTFVRAYRALPGFKAEAAFATWLYRIGVNVCLNRKALKEAPVSPLIDADRHAATGDGPDVNLMRRERAARVRRAIAQLPGKQRATLILRTYQELSHEEIAEILGATTGASKTNFFHALRRLKRLLTDE